MRACGTVMLPATEIPRKRIPTLLAILISSPASLAMAGEVKPYSRQYFDQRTAANQPFVLDVSAPLADRADDAVLSALPEIRRNSRKKTLAREPFARAGPS